MTTRYGWRCTGHTSTCPTARPSPDWPPPSACSGCGARDAGSWARWPPLAARSVRHYLYGGKDGVAELMADELRRQVPGLEVVGTESPPFTPITDEHLEDWSGASVTPGRTPVDRSRHPAPGLPRAPPGATPPMPVVPVGAAFDFWSGAVREAPRVVQGTGLEWVYRLAAEPKRLWRRYLIGNPRFLVSPGATGGRPCGSWSRTTGTGPLRPAVRTDWWTPRSRSCARAASRSSSDHGQRRHRPGVAACSRRHPAGLLALRVRRFSRLLRDSRPDVVHLHNVYPLISPYVVRVAGRQGVPVVQTVHNYRHGCVNGLHLRDGRPCTDCLGTRLGLPAVQHGCYRGSRAQTVPMAIGQVVHRAPGATASRATSPSRPSCATSSSPPGSTPTASRVRPTWVSDPGVAGRRVETCSIVGRLDEPKGIDRLLDAWARGGPSGRRLVVAGDGPLAATSRRPAQDRRTAWLGQVPSERVAEAMRGRGVRRGPVPRLRGLSAGGGRGVRPRARGPDGRRRQCRERSSTTPRDGWSTPPRTHSPVPWR